MEKYGEGKYALHAVIRKDSLSPPVEEWTGLSALQLIKVKELLYQTDTAHAGDTMWKWCPWGLICH